MEIKKEINALEKFMQNLYWGESLNPEEAIKNLEKGIFEIKYSNGEHSSNGLFITNNGYALTSNHCVEKYKEKFIEDSEGQKYKIERICQKNKEKDIVLIKTTKNTSVSPLIYKIKNVHELMELYPLGYLVEHKSRWDGEIKNSFGQIKKTKRKERISNHKGQHKKLEDQIDVEMPLIPGDSGGILLDYIGNLTGFASASNQKNSSFSSIFAGFDLIQKEINLLENPFKRKLRYFF